LIRSSKRLIWMVDRAALGNLTPPSQAKVVLSWTARWRRWAILQEGRGDEPSGPQDRNRFFPTRSPTIPLISHNIPPLSLSLLDWMWYNTFVWDLSVLAENIIVLSLCFESSFAAIFDPSGLLKISSSFFQGSSRSTCILHATLKSGLN
jgi:hypothetical protein